MILLQFYKAHSSVDAVKVQIQCWSSGCVSFSGK